MIVFSVIASLTAAKSASISSDTAFSLVWGLFNTLLMMLILLFYLFRRFGAYILSVLKKPPVSVYRGICLYILFFPGMLLITVLSLVFFRLFGLSPVPQQIIHLYLETDSFFLLFLLFFMSCVVAPFTEEIIFRGIIYPGLKEKFPVYAAIFLSSLIFALMHNEVFVFAGLLAFGVLLACLFEKYDNLWLPISVHFFNNLFANIAVFIVKYTDMAKTLGG